MGTKTQQAWNQVRGCRSHRFFATSATALFLFYFTGFIFTCPLHGEDTLAIRQSPINYQQIAAAVRISRPLDKEFWLLVATDKALMVLDIETTLTWKERDPKFHELNPFLPRQPSRTRMYVQLTAWALLSDYGTYRLRHAGHSRLARAAQLSRIGLSLWCTQHNWRGMPKSPH